MKKYKGIAIDADSLIYEVALKRNDFGGYEEQS